MIKGNLNYNQGVQPNTAKLEELKLKLPEYFTTAGNFDLDKFRDDLKKNNVDELSSGYQLDFIGKDYAKKQAGERPSTAIVPDVANNRKDKNKQSNNLFFTGDNLEVLRHLQSNYQNSIDLIYIDPPYNTGNDGFVYPDDFEYTDQKMKNMFGLDDDALKRLKTIQGKATHSAWLTFMYPRLYLAKKLLKESGVIFVSIDGNEQANLKLLMNALFGEGSSVDELIWKGKGGGQDSIYFVPVYENIIVYAKNKSQFEIGSYYVSEAEKDYRYFDEVRKLKYKRQLARKWGSNARRQDRPNLYFGITAPDGTEVFPHLPDGTDGRWRHNKVRLQQEIKDGQFEFVKNNNEWILYQKIFAPRNGKKSKKFTNLIDDISSGTGTKYVENLFGGKKVFDYPKPTELIKRFISMVDDDELNILDFFAGSSTTADAVMQLNAEDGGHRKFIMATLPEPTYAINKDGKEVATKGGKAAFDAGYRTIDEISRERIVRAAKKIREEHPELPEDFDDGFKHYRVVSPTAASLDDLEYSDNVQQNLLDNMVDQFSAASLTEAHKNTVPKEDFPWHGYDLGKDASGKDTILQTWLVADGYKFDVTTDELDFAGYKVPYVDGTRLYLIDKGWSAKNTKKLVNEIGNNKLTVQTIVVYGYNFDLESLNELQIALQQLDVKVNLNERF